MAERSYMLMVEPYETTVLLESLMLLREKTIEEYGTEDHRIQVLMRNIMLRAGLPHSKSIAPEAYELCYPEGPPRIVGTYGKYRE